jgi:hypothetical protein
MLAERPRRHAGFAEAAVHESDVTDVDEAAKVQVVADVGGRLRVAEALGELDDVGDVGEAVVVGVERVWVHRLVVRRGSRGAGAEGVGAQLGLAFVGEELAGADGGAEGVAVYVIAGGVVAAVGVDDTVIVLVSADGVVVAGGAEGGPGLAAVDEAVVVVVPADAEGAVRAGVPR